jgi:hypothetical protein
MDLVRLDGTRAKVLRGNMDNFLAFDGRGAGAPITLTKTTGTAHLHLPSHFIVRGDGNPLGWGAIQWILYHRGLSRSAMAAVYYHTAQRQSV